jgi:hypothetical protein
VNNLVNYFLLTDKELLERYEEILENEDLYDFFDPEKDKDYHEVRSMLLERMKNNKGEC